MDELDPRDGSGTEEKLLAILSFHKVGEPSPGGRETWYYTRESEFLGYLGALRESRKDVFAGTKLLKDGTLDTVVLERNLNRAPEEQQRPLLVDALNELLYAELLAVKRTLGADHEASIIRALKER